MNQVLWVVFILCYTKQYFYFSCEKNFQIKQFFSLQNYLICFFGFLKFIEKKLNQVLWVVFIFVLSKTVFYFSCEKNFRGLVLFLRMQHIRILLSFLYICWEKNRSTIMGCICFVLYKTVFSFFLWKKLKFQITSKILIRFWYICSLFLNSLRKNWNKYYGLCLFCVIQNSIFIFLKKNLCWQKPLSDPIFEKQRV